MVRRSSENDARLKIRAAKKDARMRKEGWVYVVSMGRGIFKVGMSRKPNPRFDNLRRQAEVYHGEPMVVHMLELVEYPRLVESTLHKLLSDRHIKYEYYALSHEDLDILEYILGMGFLHSLKS